MLGFVLSWHSNSNADLMLPVDRWHATVLNGPAEAADLARRTGSWCPSSSYPHLISNWAQIDNPHRGVAIFDRQMTAVSAQKKISLKNEPPEKPSSKVPTQFFKNLAVKTLRAGALSKTQNLHVGGFGEDVGCGLTCAD